MGKLNLTKFCSRPLANESDPSDRVLFAFFFFLIIERVMARSLLTVEPFTNYMPCKLYFVVEA